MARDNLNHTFDEERKMPKLNTYLTFNGECEQAFEFYKSVFGGELTEFQRFGDMPPIEDMPAPDNPEHVMHVSLPIGDDILMGSDTSSHFGEAIFGNNFSISVAPDSKEDADKFFAGLSDGGQVVMPMADTFWNAYFGVCVDKFGIAWMINFGNG